MKMKLAILDCDQSYLSRIVNAFTVKYSDKLELYSFTNKKAAFDSLNNSKIDILVASDDFEIDVNELPGRCGFAYLADSNEIASLKGQKAIYKYQKTDLLYKEILSVYSELTDIPVLKAGDKGNTKIFAFLSASGGTGSSTLAASFAMAAAGSGKKALYLNLEQFGTAGTYFTGQGQFDFGDIIYAIKSRKPTLPMKLESTVKQDTTGVYFYDSCKYALELDEMTVDDFDILMTALRNAGYDYIIMDMEFTLEKKYLFLMKEAHNIIFVSDGTETANRKFLRAYQALEMIEQDNDSSLLTRINLMYNKFSNKTGIHIKNNDINVIGGFQKIELATINQILTTIQDKKVFEKLLLF